MALEMKPGRRRKRLKLRRSTKAKRHLQLAAGALVGVVGGAAGFVANVESTTTADAVAASPGFGTNGYLYMSSVKAYSGVLWMSTNTCDQDRMDRLNDTWNNIKNSTQGIWWRWGTNGVRMSTHSCTWEVSGSIDAWIAFGSQPVGYFGQNHPLQSDSAYCASQGAYWPCGRRDLLEISNAVYNSFSKDVKNRGLIHETGHTHALLDICNSGISSVMNNGSSGSCGWGDGLTGWTNYDRADINSLYP
jgi:hypothetical protein